MWWYKINDYIVFKVVFYNLVFTYMSLLSIGLSVNIIYLVIIKFIIYTFIDQYILWFSWADKLNKLNKHKVKYKLTINKDYIIIYNNKCLS